MIEAIVLFVVLLAVLALLSAPLMLMAVEIMWMEEDDAGKG